MATTNVLLREDVEHLGARGEIVRVKAGFARNYLLPRRLAVEATASNIKQIEQERSVLLKREAKEKTIAQSQADQMRLLHAHFERRVGDHGILYGSVTTMDIAEWLKDNGYEIDRRRIVLREPIKEPGEFTVAVRLHREVTIELPVTVAAEAGTGSQSGTGSQPEGTVVQTSAETQTGQATTTGGAATTTEEPPKRRRRNGKASQ